MTISFGGDLKGLQFYGEEYANMYPLRIISWGGGHVVELLF